MRFFVMVVLLAAFGVSNALTNVSACQSLSVSSEQYVLNQSIFANLSSPSDVCLSVDADNIILDCRGYQIMSIGSARGYAGVYLGNHSDGSSVSNSTVQNCQISNFDVDIFVDGGDNLLIQNNSLTSTTQGEGLMTSSGDTNAISHTIFRGNTISGHSAGIVLRHGSSVNFSIYNNSISATTGLSAESPPSLFFNNTIQSDVWVYTFNAPNVTFNNTVEGNNYLTANGTPAGYIFNITDINLDGWADIGSSLPFNHETVGHGGSDTGGYYSSDGATGVGGDYHPFVGPPRFSNDILQSTPALVNQNVSWAVVVNLSQGYGNCSYTITKNAVLNLTTIRNNTGGVIANTGNQTSPRWSCGTAASPYNISFYTEPINKSIETVSYPLGGTLQRRIYLFSQFSNNVSFQISEVPTFPISIDLWKCESANNATCGNASVFSPVSWTIVSGTVYSTVTLTQNETVYVLTWEPSSGGGSGGGPSGLPSPQIQVNQTQVPRQGNLPISPTGQAVQSSVDGLLRGRTGAFPNIALVLIGLAGIVGRTVTSKNAPSPLENAVTFAATFLAMILFYNYGGGLTL